MDPIAGQELDYRNRVFLTDASKMSEIPSGAVDLIVTSPPYFSVKDYSLDGRQVASHGRRHSRQIGDTTDFDDFISRLLQVWRECERVLRPNGKMVINSPLMPMLKSELSTHESRDIFDLNAAIQQSIVKNIRNVHLLDTYIWSRTNPSKKLMFGSYPYPPNFYAQNTIEFVTVYVKAGKAKKVSKAVKEASRLTQDEWVSYTAQIWELPVPNRADLGFGVHSALMPEQLVERCVRLYSFVGDLVLDPFAGSGTTLRVSKRLGRDFVGYEVMPSYGPLIDEKVGSRVSTRVRARARRAAATTSFPDDLRNVVRKTDATAFLQRLPEGSVDLLCTDPPYNLGKGEWDRWDSEKDYRDFMVRWMSEAVRVLKPGGSLYVFNTPRNCAWMLVELEAMGLSFGNWITWDKPDGFSSTKRRFVPSQETILYLVKPGADPVFNSESVRVPYQSTERIAAAARTGITKNGKRWYPNPAGKLCTDVWRIASARHSKKVAGRVVKGDHPTEKPIEMMERIIAASSNPGDVVVDCFGGIGTTAVAAIRLGRDYALCESDGDYIQVARRRIGEAEALISTECP